VLIPSPMRRLSCIALAVGLVPSLFGQSADRAASTAATASGGKAGFVASVIRPLRPAAERPLSRREKFRDYVDSTFSWVPLASNAATAAITFGLDNPVEWEQDAGGYAKRLGDKLARNTIRTSVTYPTSLLLREDNRYFASGRSGVPGRVLFALSSPFRARRPGGHYSFSFSSSAGILASNFTALGWAPPSWRSASSVTRGIGYSYLGISGLNIFREFVPDILRALHR
jgi:hypothetical protein